MSRRKAATLLTGLALLFLWAFGVLLVLRDPLSLEVEVEMASDTPGRIQLFADDGAGFREALTDHDAVLGYGGWEIHRLKIDVLRPITALRLDPLNVPGRFRIRSIAVDFGGRKERFHAASLADWEKDHHLRSAGHGEELDLVAEGSDPRLVLRREWTDPGSGSASWIQPPTGEELALIFLGIPFLLLGTGSEPSSRLFSLRHLLALTVPLGVFLVLNLRALDSWWLHDDPCLLRAALRGGIAPHFYDPEIWRALSGSVLMPWTILSLGLDAHLFGLEPAAFYGHQIFSFGVLLVGAYILLRRFCSIQAASLALTLFVVSTPSFAVAQRLMNRHYLEGLILFLAAFALYLRALRTERLRFAFLGTVFFFLATTAKEVFVPLVAVLPFLPIGELRSRFRASLPFLGAVALYAPWRLFMLGAENSFSGYAARSSEAALIDLGAVSSSLGFGNAWQLLFVALATGGAICALQRRFLGAAAITMIALLLPLVPVLREVWPRYFFLPALVLAVLTAYALERWVSHGTAVRRSVFAGLGLALMLFALEILDSSPLRRGHPEAVKQHRAEGEFVLESTEKGRLLTRLEDTRYLSCVADLRKRIGGAKGPGFCGDACYCAGAFAGETFWHQAGRGLTVSEVAGRSSCAQERELSVEMRYRKPGRLAWRMGPYTSGAYEFLLVSEADNVSVPAPIAPAGEAPITLAEPFRWIVRYRSLEGWRTYSPILVLDPEVGALHWERPISDGRAPSAGRKDGANPSSAGTSDGMTAIESEDEHPVTEAGA